MYYTMDYSNSNKEFISRNDVYNQVIGGNGGDLANNSIQCYQYDLDGKMTEEYDRLQKEILK